MQNKNRAEQLPYPWRGIGALMVFLLLAPPVYVAAAVFMEHSWVGGRQLLFEIAALARGRFLPALMGGYSLYMPPVFFAGASAAWRCAQGRGLSLSGAVWRMVIAGFACEVFYQIFVLAAGGRLRADVFMTDGAQWILSAFVCWAACVKIGAARAGG